MNTFWFRSGSDGWDFGAQRNTSDGWKSYPDPRNPKVNEDNVGYGAPLYAVSDGEVIASWRNAPDNIRPGDPHPGRLVEPPTIPRSGNFLAVQEDDGSVILYAHLIPGSVPEELCPFSDEFVTDAEDKVKPPGVTSRTVPRETMLPAGSRPRVRRGQFLGRVGNSGASSGPHVHLDRKDAGGDAKPFAHDRAWMTDKQDPSDWSPFDGQVVDSDDKQVVILPSPLLRRGAAGAGGFGELAMHFVRSRRVVTALSDSDGNLKLVSWGLTPEQIERRGDASAGRVGSTKDKNGRPTKPTASDPRQWAIGIAEPQSDIVVTAVRDNEGKLRLISWRIEGDGSITRLGQGVAGDVKRLAIATVRRGTVVTAVQDSNNDLKLIAWSVAPDGSITREGQAQAGRVLDVAVTRAERCEGVVTAVRTGTGELKLISWQVSPSGNRITRLESAGAGESIALSLTTLGTNRQFVLTALRDASGRARLVNWSLGPDGAMERLATGLAGEVTELEITGWADESTAVTACRDGAGRLRLITWDLSADGQELRRAAGALAGPAQGVMLAGTRDAGRDFLVTGCADSDGNLKLINWEANI